MSRNRSGSVRGRVWKWRDTWYYEVSVGTCVVFADNARSWAKMLRDCERDVFVARRVVSAGHGFHQSWSEIVDDEMRRGS